MKSYLIILILFSLLFCSCSSSPRFSSDDDSSKNSRYKKEKKEPVTRDTKEIRLKNGNKNASLEKVTGVASFYSEKYHGRKTANGETYDMYDLTAAHASYPFNTIVKVINLKNNKAVTLRINDRQPDFNGRIIDVSYQAARELDMLINGIAHVQLEVIEWGK